MEMVTVIIIYGPAPSGPLESYRQILINHQQDKQKNIDRLKVV